MPHESPEKNFYPLFLDLSGLHCLVAGLGGVGSRKLQGLLPPKLHDRIPELLDVIA